MFTCVLATVAAAMSLHTSALQIYMLFLIHAYSTKVWKQREAAYNGSVSIAAIEHGFQSPQGHSKLVMDGPWTLLWPCFLIWPFFEAVIGYIWLVNATGVHRLNSVHECGCCYS